MALEDLTGPSKFITSLNPANPPINDPAEEGAAHISGTKNVLVNSFPNINAPVTVTPAQLNSVATALQPNTAIDVLGVNAGKLGAAGFLKLARPSDGAIAWNWTVDGAGNCYLYDLSGTRAAVNFAPAGALTVYGDLFAQLNGQIAAYRNDAQAFVRLFQSGNSYPAIEFYYGGVGQMGMGIASTGEVWHYSGSDINTWYMKERPNGYVDFRYAITVGQFIDCSAKTSRNDTGHYSNAQSLDAGKAPGMARGYVVTDGGGNFSFDFGFVITDPIITATAFAAGAPTFASLQGRSSTGCTGTAYLWNGAAMVPAPGATVMIMAIDITAAPGR